MKRNALLIFTLAALLISNDVFAQMSRESLNLLSLAIYCEIVSVILIIVELITVIFFVKKSFFKYFNIFVLLFLCSSYYVDFLNYQGEVNAAFFFKLFLPLQYPPFPTQVLFILFILSIVIRAYKIKKEKTPDRKEFWTNQNIANRRKGGDLLSITLNKVEYKRTSKMSKTLAGYHSALKYKKTY